VGPSRAAVTIGRKARRPAGSTDFPEDDSGDTETDDIPLERAWANLETVHERGLTHTLGVCNVSREQLQTILDAGSVRPALVRIERHPYQPRTEMVLFCHERGIRVVAHSPLSAPGLLAEHMLAEIADANGLTPAGVVLAWNVTRGVVPIPSSTTQSHVVSNLAAAGRRLDAEACDRIETLRKPDFER